MLGREAQTTAHPWSKEGIFRQLLKVASDGDVGYFAVQKYDDSSQNCTL